VSDFKTYTSENVEFVQPKLNQLYRWDDMFKHEDGNLGKYVPANADEPNAIWSTSFIMEKPAAIELWNAAKAHFTDRNQKEKFSAIHSYRQLEDGRIQFSAKKKAKTRKGEINKPPAMADHNCEDLADRAIWSGSKGNITFLMMPTRNPSNKEWGISLLLDELQVVDPIYGGTAKFGSFSKTAAPVPIQATDETPPNDDPFGLPNQSTPSAPAPTPDYDLDDEIPF